jgi:NADPH-dependent glutamate synthase beta subunit-like oxidoreductase
LFRYNGVPQFTPGPQLDQEEAVVVGNGNVAIDCSRILLSSPQRLAQTDITEQALRALKKSRVRNIRVLGRRGPKEASWNDKSYF